MKNFRMTFLFGLQVLLFSVGIARGGNSKIIWDMAKDGRFDRTHKGYVVDNGCVVVDLQDEKSLCPIGFRRLIRSQDSVRKIVLRYQLAQTGRYWLHIIWNPGTSGKEQFEVLFNGTLIGTSQLINGSKTPNQETVERFSLEHKRGANEIQLRYLSGDGLRFGTILLSTEEKLPYRIKPSSKFPTITDLASYEKEIDEPGVFIDSDHVGIYAPKRKEKEAKIVHGYLVKAYNELYRIVGIHTKDKIIVYSLPKDRPYGHRLGRTTECKIWYTYQNLEFESQPEWKRYGVPHVSGYIEEMAHNFVSASLAVFGNEMTGWSISKIVSEKVAGNPIYNASLVRARQIQARTFARYKKLNNTFPKDIPVNLCDRIHAHLLFLCEKQYGPRFWTDFFREIRKAKGELLSTNRYKTSDERRNARYRITIECFERLMEGKFTKMLKNHGISLTTDVVSLHYKHPEWNRKFE